MADDPRIHTKNLLNSLIGNHVMATSIIIGVLILLIVVLIIVLVHYRNESKSGFEGLVSKPCPDGYTLRTDGSSQYCVPIKYVPDMSTCNADWDPSATAEAQALTSVGSYQHDGYGEKRFQDIINGAYDGTGLSNAQLQDLMHQGGAP